MPADPHRLEPMREVLRIVEGVEGNVALSVIVDPRPDYGRRRARRSRRERIGLRLDLGQQLLGLKTDAPLSSVSDTNAKALDARVTIAAGSKFSFSLCYAKGDIGCIAPLGAASEQRLASTSSGGNNGHVAAATTVRIECRDPQRSRAQAHDLFIVGRRHRSPTTSLPEALGGNRNWDYGYCWMRDAALTMRAFTELGFKEEARAFLRMAPAHDATHLAEAAGPLRRPRSDRRA